MVYSASSPEGVIDGSGYGASDFLRYLMAAGVGLILMRLCEQFGLDWFSERNVRLLLYGCFGLLLAVLVPGIGREVQGGRRWIGAGPLEFQPSELIKLALILYVARHLAEHPRRMRRGFREALAPVAVVVAPACGLIIVEPDLGTALVVLFTMISLLVVAGVPMNYLGKLLLIIAVLIGALVIMEPYRMARLTSFLHPFAHTAGNGWQPAQSQIAVGTGGISGVGLGQSVAKAFWLPEAQTDFILAVVGEELGLLGITAVACLYGMIAYAGLRTARRAASRYTKLLASGLTSLILCQGILNIFVVLGLAPLTGVPLPFISYAPSNMIVMLICVGLLQAIARPAARELRLADPEQPRSGAAGREYATDPDRHGRYGGTRRTGAGGRRALEG